MSLNRSICLPVLFIGLSLLSYHPVFAETVSPYGICAHVSRHGDHELADEEFKLMRQAGIAWARTDFDWTTAQPTQHGPWDYSMLDTTVEKAEKAGIKILPILCYDVSWASPAYKHLDAWLEYVRRTVTRYQGQLKYWEVWNEQDGAGFWKDTPNPANYTLLLKATYQEIKKINPDLTVLLGGLSGIPYEYVEGIYKAGGAPYFDIMVVHPYRYPQGPEANSLKADLEKLRRMMAQYGDQDKPIWLTEIGWPTHENSNGILDEIVRCGLHTIDPERKDWTLAVLDQPGYPTPVNFSDKRLKSMLPGTGHAVRLDMKQMKELSAQKYQALFLPPEEAFAADCFDSIEAYVREGGTVIFTQGIPLYYTCRQESDGSWKRQGADESYRRRLHVGWEAWWTRQGVPKEISDLTIPAGFETQIHPDKYPNINAARFLNDKAMKASDRFIPLVQAKSGDYTGTASAVYDLNSDLKGAVIVSAFQQDFRGLPEDKQAAVLPRAYLIALHSGVDCMFWYNLRARENNPFYNEDNFGIIHKDLKPKPAYRAMRTLTRARPAGSVCLEGEWQTGGIYHPGWKRPDGKTAFAIWTGGVNQEITLTFEGTLTEMFDNFGKPLNLNPQNGQIGITVTENPIYLVGPETIKIN